MTAFQHIKSGIQLVLKSWEIILLYYFACLISALLISLPLQTALSDFFGQSLLADQLMREFDWQYFFEFLRVEPLLISNLIQNFIYMAFIFGVITIFFLGGTIKFWCCDVPVFRFATFFNYCLVYFHRFLKLFGLWLIAGGLIFLLHFLTGSLIDKILGDYQNDRVIFFIQVARWSVFILILLFISLVFDYAKIQIVLHDLVLAREALVNAWRFVLSHFLPALAIYGTIFLFGLIVLGLSWLITGMFQVSNSVTVIILFLFQQLFIFVRLGIKLLFYASQLSYSRSINPSRNDFRDVPPMEMPNDLSPE